MAGGDPLTQAERGAIDRVTVELSKDIPEGDLLQLLTRAIRGGFAAGLAYPGAGLTPQKVRRMRQLRAANVPATKIAADEHVPLDLVREICRGP